MSSFYVYLHLNTNNTNEQWNSNIIIQLYKVCTYVCLCICMYRCVCMYLRMYVCMYVCIYIRMYACMYVCMYVFCYTYSTIICIICIGSSYYCGKKTIHCICSNVHSIS